MRVMAASRTWGATSIATVSATRRPCTSGTTRPGSSPYDRAHLDHARTTLASESTSTPSQSNSTARHGKQDGVMDEGLSGEEWRGAGTPAPPAPGAGLVGPPSAQVGGLPAGSGGLPDQ